MKHTVASGSSFLGLFAAGAAHADIITHEDPGQEMMTTRGAGSAPAGRLAVSSDQAIEGFGVDIALNGDSHLKFLIYDSTSGELL